MKSPARKFAEQILVAASLAILLACGTPRPPLPPSLELPKVVTDLRGARKGDRVTLVWTVPTKTTDNTNLHHLGPTLVCRSLEVAINRCDPVGVVQPSDLPPPKPPAKSSNSKNGNPSGLVQATFVDIVPKTLQEQNPTGFGTYAVETQNTKLRSAGLSNQIQIPLAPTLPPPTDLHAEMTPDGVVLTWTGVLPAAQAPGISYLYRVYRREQGSKAVSVAGELPLSISAQPRFVDSGFEAQKTYHYSVTVVSVVTRTQQAVAQVEGDDSPPVTIVANDVFPPAAPVGLQAVASGVGQTPFIDLTWAPNTEADLAGYNVYRRQGSGQWTKINKDMVKTPAFRDTDVARGNEYSYSVSAIDLRGNESPRSEETSEKIP